MNAQNELHSEFNTVQTAPGELFDEAIQPDAPSDAEDACPDEIGIIDPATALLAATL